MFTKIVQRSLVVFLFIISIFQIGWSQDLLERVSTKPKLHKYNLSICAIFQNEARYLKEWIEFHKIVGVQHFYLYNNCSIDHYLTVLAPYIKSGEVELIEWNYPSQNQEEWNYIQCQAYEDALRRSRDKTLWLAILDTDEFLFATREDSLVKFLKKYKKYGGLVVNWQMYGTSHVSHVPDNRAMIEMLVLKAPDQFPENRFYKSIVQPTRVESILDPHKAIYKEGYFNVRPNKQRVRKDPMGIYPERIRINHYWSRDERFFYEVKCARRQKWAEGLDGQLSRIQQLNQVRDESILRFVPTLRKNLGMDPR